MKNLSALSVVHGSRSSGSGRGGQRDDDGPDVTLLPTTKLLLSFAERSDRTCGDDLGKH